MTALNCPGIECHHGIPAAGRPLACIPRGVGSATTPMYAWRSAWARSCADPVLERRDGGMSQRGTPSGSVFPMHPPQAHRGGVWSGGRILRSPSRSRSWPAWSSRWRMTSSSDTRRCGKTPRCSITGPRSLTCGWTLSNSRASGATRESLCQPLAWTVGKPRA